MLQQDLVRAKDAWEAKEISAAAELYLLPTYIHTYMYIHMLQQDLVRAKDAWEAKEISAAAEVKRAKELSNKMVCI
jgi:hypothetical protein